MLYFDSLFLLGFFGIVGIFGSLVVGLLIKLGGKGVFLGVGGLVL